MSSQARADRPVQTGPVGQPPDGDPPRDLRWWLRRLAPLLYLPVFLAWYFLLEGRPTTGMIEVCAPLDALISFDARWVIGYFVWFGYLPGFIGWLYVVDWRRCAEIGRLAFFLIVGMTACLVGYTCWPTTQTLRPGSYPDQGIFTTVVAWLQGFDDPSNVFPSLHVYTSIVVCFGVVTSRYVRAAWVRWASFGLLLVITASTCFLKQHSILDALGAAALFGLVWLAWRGLTRAAGGRRAG